MKIAGVDYGSKLAGTTVIAFSTGEDISIRQSEKNQDADLFLQQIVQEEELDTLFIDAPLSLPKAYFGQGQDFFYRSCDRELGAMSPMFLGGLTARAMKLQHQWKGLGIQCFETYPAQTAKRLDLINKGYKKEVENIPKVLKLISAALGRGLPTITNWHQVDALLALIAANRYQSNTHQTVGNPSEGCIYL